MNEASPPAESLDWSQLATTLQRFASTTGLEVGAYDADGQRRVGPIVTSRVAALLEAAGNWAPGGAALRLEQALTQQVVRAGGPVSQRVGDELQVLAVPAMVDGAVGGVVVIGWVFGTFTTPLGCRRLADELAVDPARLWAEARLQAPVPPARLQTASELLATLLDLMDQHARAIRERDRLASTREAFLAYVSHELRTPLHAIGLRLQVLLRSPPQGPEQLRSHLARMARHVEDESRLVEDLIDAARTRTGQLALHPQPGPVGEWIGRAVESVRPVAESKPVSLLAPPLHELDALQVDGDAGRLQQVLWNLLANAVKFTPAGGEVRLTVHADPTTVHVAVSDTGSGIDAALLPHIFDPFTKQQRSNTQGLGLGLAIAREIVEKHGGSIQARSDGAGTGSTFTVRLPRHAAI